MLAAVTIASAILLGWIVVVALARRLGDRRQDDIGQRLGWRVPRSDHVAPPNPRSGVDKAAAVDELLRGMTTAVFTAEEQEALAGDPDVRAYVGVIKTHLVGLLCALSEYARRTGFDWPGLFAPIIGVASAEQREVADAHRALVDWYHEHSDWELDRSAALRVASPVAGRAREDEWIFDADEQMALSYLKYGHGFEHVTRRELVPLLKALGQFVARAPRAPLLSVDSAAHGVGVLRALNAHNALLDFGQHPFGWREYAASVRRAVTLASGSAHSEGPSDTGTDVGTGARSQERRGGHTDDPPDPRIP